MEYGLLMFGLGIATGAGAAAWLSARRQWSSAVQKWKDRKHSRGVWQLTYRSRFTPTIEDRSPCTVREPLLTSK